MKFGIFVFFVFLIARIECSRILIVYSTMSHSHMIPLQALSEVLAAKGHEVTFFSPFPLKKQVKNYRDIKISFNETLKEELMGASMSNQGFTTMLKMVPKMVSMMRGISIDTLKSEEMQRMMKEEKFDLLILGFGFNEFLLGLANHFNCPSVLFSPAGAVSIFNKALGNPTAVEGAAHMMFSVKQMNFLWRVGNFAANGVDIFLTNILQYFNRQLYNEYFPADRYRSYDETLHSVSLALTNTHFSTGVVRPMLPNFIEVGGLQVKPEPSPLPGKLKTFLDEAKDGAILFSLGSNAKSTFLSKEVISALLKVFSELKQRVVMKWEADTLEGKPENVFISKWLPQDDVLAHPNIKAFISHCGLGGMVEAKYHGVPIVGIPLFGDQPANAETLLREGWGIKIELSELTEETLRNGLRTILDDPKYALTVKKFSELTRDRPLNAQDTAIFWLEYVIRHRGAPHMHYPGADLNFFQYNSLDVIFFVFAVIYAACKIFAFVCRKIYCFTCRSMTKKLKKN